MRSSDFLRHCKEGNDAEVRRALESGINVNTCNNRGTSALHMACIYDRPTTVQLLLKVDGININAGDSFGTTALHFAVSRKNLKSVEILAAMPNIDINATDKQGMTALHSAVMYLSKAKVTPILIENGIDINLEIDIDKSALQLACESGNRKDIETLVNLGCNFPWEKEQEGEESDSDDTESYTYDYVIEALASTAAQRKASCLALEEVHWLPSVQKQEILDFLFLRDN